MYVCVCVCVLFREGGVGARRGGTARGGSAWDARAVYIIKGGYVCLVGEREGD